MRRELFDVSRTRVTVGLYAPVADWARPQSVWELLRGDAWVSAFTVVFNPARNPKGPDLETFWACIDTASVSLVEFPLANTMSDADIARLGRDISRVLTVTHGSCVVVLTETDTHTLGPAWPTPLHVHAGDTRRIVRTALDVADAFEYVHVFWNKVALESEM